MCVPTSLQGFYIWGGQSPSPPFIPNSIIENGSKRNKGIATSIKTRVLFVHVKRFGKCQMFLKVKEMLKGGLLWCITIMRGRRANDQRVARARRGMEKKKVRNGNRSN